MQRGGDRNRQSSSTSVSTGGSDVESCPDATSNISAAAPRRASLASQARLQSLHRGLNRPRMLTYSGDPLSKHIISPDEMTDAMTRRLTKSSGRFTKIAQGVACHVWLFAHQHTLGRSTAVLCPSPPR